LLDEWTADHDLPSAKIGGDTSTRHRTLAISLAPQDEIRVEGLPDRGDPAAIDSVEITATPSSVAPN
jgi:hypothetical protein